MNAFDAKKMILPAVLVLVAFAPQALAKTTTTFPKNVSGAAFNRACEASHGEVNSAGENHLSCTNKNGTTDCQTDEQGNLEVCVHNDPRKPPRRQQATGGGGDGHRGGASSGNASGNNGQGGNGGNGGGGRPGSASGGNGSAASSASLGGSGNTTF